MGCLEKENTIDEFKLFIFIVCDFCLYLRKIKTEKPTTILNNYLRALRTYTVVISYTESSLPFDEMIRLDVGKFRSTGKNIIFYLYHHRFE